MKVRPAFGFLVFLALPISGFSQSTLNFPRLFSVADLGNSGFAAINPSSSPAILTYKLYSTSGTVVATQNQTIPARGQLSLLGSQVLCPPGPNPAAPPPPCPSPSAPGWIQATSSTTGLQGFFLGGDFSNFMDGAEPAPVAPELIFPLATSTTELNVASLAASTNTVAIRIYDAAGIVLSTTTRDVVANGIFQGTLGSLFPSVNFTNAKYVKVTGTGNITGTSVAIDFIYAPSWSVVNGVATSTNVLEANFPHVPSGPENGSAKWNSVIGITNLSSTAQNLTLTYNRSSGGSVSVQRSLAANGSLRESVKDVFAFGIPAEDGWVKVTATAPIAGYIGYGYSGTSGVAVVPVQNLPQTQMIFSHVANGPSWGSGLALLNATTSDAAVEVYIMQPGGALVGGAQDSPAASINLRAGAKIAGLLDQFVPAAHSDGGFVYLKSANNVPLYAFQLFFSRDNKVIANVAAGVIDTNISFAPPPAPLTITSISPLIAARGTDVTVTGTGFSSAKADNAVVFSTATGSVSVTPSAAVGTSLTVTVPSTAVIGPVYVTMGGKSSTSVMLAVTSEVSVSESQNTVADIYVSAPAGSTALNITGTALTDATAIQASLGSSSVEITTGQTKLLWITGDGISIPNGTSVTISGGGVTVTPFQTQNNLIILTIAVAPTAGTGARNINVTNSNLDTSVYTGGLIIR